MKVPLDGVVICMFGCKSKCGHVSAAVPSTLHGHIRGKSLTSLSQVTWPLLMRMYLYWIDVDAGRLTVTIRHGVSQK